MSFSYFGLFYDLIIPFLLWNKKTRPFAFIAIVIFHTLIALLFNIGMFPWIMIAGSSIFISIETWNKVLKKGIKIPEILTKKKHIQIPVVTNYVLIVFFVIQILFPLRHLLYNENVLWTERNYRFSWNVMLMEKRGYFKFVVNDKNSEKIWQEYPRNHLTVIQEKEMSFQPDMIWQYAYFLEKKYSDLGFDVKVTVDSYVALNGRPSRLFISMDVNLLSLSRNEIYDYVLKD